MIRQEAYQQRWTDIEQFAIDDPGSVVKFSDKLQHQQGWTTEFTARVITEYKKFIFLCMVVPEGASPSAIVDEAWHLHLTYTVNYWDGLCKNVLGRPLHHHPSRGGPQEKERHVNWYRESLDHYRHYFGEDPPPDIWPPPQDQINKGSSHPSEFPSQYFLFLLLPFFIPFIFNSPTPFGLTGLQFILFILALTGAVLILLNVQAKRHIEKIRFLFKAIDSSRLNIFQYTRSVYGRQRMIQAAVVDLIQRGYLKPAPENRLQIMDKPDAYSEDYNPLLPNIYYFHLPGENVNMVTLEKISDEEKGSDALFDIEINNLPQHNWTAILLVGGLVFISTIRLLQGIINEKPVAYIVILLLLFVFIGFEFITKQSSRKLLPVLATEEYNTQGLLLKDILPTPLTGQFIFHGMIALAAMDGIDQLTGAFQRQVHENGYHPSASSGCGGSGCSGSGDGGGCGGGGCGGGCGGCGG